MKQVKTQQKGSKFKERIHVQPLRTSSMFLMLICVLHFYVVFLSMCLYSM